MQVGPQLMAEGRGRVVSLDWNDGAVSPQTFSRAYANLTGGSPAASNPFRGRLSFADRIGIKVSSERGPIAGVRVEVVDALLRCLVEAGYDPGKILIWDRSESSLRAAGFGALATQWGVGLVGSVERGYDIDVSYDAPLIGDLIWSDLEFGEEGDGVGRRSYVTKALTEDIDKIIQITPMNLRRESGVAGQLWSLARDSVDNFRRFEKSPEFLSQAIPEIVAMREVGDKFAFGIVDATIMQYAGDQSTRLHYSKKTNALLVSLDPVALDVLSVDRLHETRVAEGMDGLDEVEEIYANAGLLLLGESRLSSVRLISLGAP